MATPKVGVLSSLDRRCRPPYLPTKRHSLSQGSIPLLCFLHLFSTSPLAFLLSPGGFSMIPGAVAFGAFSPFATALPLQIYYRDPYHGGALPGAAFVLETVSGAQQQAEENRP